MISQKSVIWIVIGIVVIAGIFLFINNLSNTEISSIDNTANLPNIDIAWSLNERNALWRTIELKDVNSQEVFKISDFSGEIVLLESFAVWCPTCTRQQKITKDFENQFPNIITVSLDTDPNEDEARVLVHTRSNGFDWRYVVSPIDVTQSLVDEFGLSFVNAPSVPMVIVCSDGRAGKLPNGLKDINELRAAVAACSQ